MFEHKFNTDEMWCTDEVQILQGANLATEDDNRAQQAQLELLHYIFLDAHCSRGLCVVEVRTFRETLFRFGR